MTPTYYDPNSNDVSRGGTRPGTDLSEPYSVDEETGAVVGGDGRSPDGFNARGGRPPSRIGGTSDDSDYEVRAFVDGSERRNDFWLKNGSSRFLPLSH